MPKQSLTAMNRIVGEKCEITLGQVEHAIPGGLTTICPTVGLISIVSY